MIARAVSHGHYGRVNQAQILATKIKASVDLRAARKLVSLLPQKPVVAKMFPMSSKKRHWICAITAHVIQLCWQWIDVIINNCRQTTVQSPVFGFVFFASFTINVVDGVSNDIKNKWSAAAATTTATTKTQRFWVLFFVFFYTSVCYSFPCLLSLAGLTWRSPQAVATMTVCRPTLPELWKPQSHLRWALFLSGTCGSVSITSNWMYLFMLVPAHLQALDEHSGQLLRALHVGDRLLQAAGELHQRQSAVGSGTNGEGVKFSVLASGIWPACVGCRIKSREKQMKSWKWAVWLSGLVLSQVRLALLQLKGLEDSYNEQLSFPLGPFSFNPLGFM